MTPEGIFALSIVGIVFTVTVIVPILIRIIYFYKQKTNPTQQDIIFHKIMKLMKDDPGKWVMPEYSTFEYAPTNLRLENGEFEVSCRYPTRINFNKHNSRRLRTEFYKLRAIVKEDKGRFLNNYLDGEMTYVFNMDRNYAKQISNELTLWLKADIDGKSFFDLDAGRIWFENQSDLVACKLRWGQNK